MYQNLQYIIDSFMAKVWRNVRGQYQFKMVEVHDVRLRRRHVFGWDRFVQRPLDDVTYFSSSRTPWNHISVSFTKSTMVNYCKVWVASRDRQVEICFMYSMDAIQIYPTKNMTALKSDITSAVLNWYWPRRFLHTFATKPSIILCSILHVIWISFLWDTLVHTLMSPV